VNAVTLALGLDTEVFARLMKIALILASLLILVAAPVNAADETSPCAEIDIVKNIASRVSLRRDCSLEVAILEDVICVGGWGDSIERNVDKHTVKVYYCTGGPSPITWPPEMASQTCKPLAESIVVGTVTVANSCHVQVDLKFYDCIWNCGWETIVDTDQLTVRQYTQQDGGTRMATAQPCDDQTVGFWGAQLTTRNDCTADVGIIDSYRVCLTGTDDQTTGLGAGGNNVYVGYCTLNVPTKAPSCNGIWYTQETIGQGRSAVTIGTDGSTECTTIDVTTPFFPGFACVQPGGPYRVASVGPITWYAYC
jgi:hypothetical protein